MKKLALIFLFALIGIAPMHAQEGPLGIAISQAPEAATGICFGEDANQTIACAQQDCMDQSGFDAIDCPVSNWCSPAGWTVDVFVQHQEGPHWHQYSCGWQSREQAEASVKITCSSEWFIECEAVNFWSPQGEQENLL